MASQHPRLRIPVETERTFDVNVVPSYTVKFRDLHETMKWERGRAFNLKVDPIVEGVEMYLKIFPNGRNIEGHFSVYLMRQGREDASLVIHRFIISVDDQVIADTLTLDSGWGCSMFVSHDKIPEGKELKIECKFLKELPSVTQENAANSNNRVVKPSCPVCFEEMSSSTRIAQCLNGHLICGSCKEKMPDRNCVFCDLPVNGRAFGMEAYLRTLFG